MTIKRLATLQLVMLGGLGSVFLLPKEIKLQPAAIALVLPADINQWHGDNEPISQGERDSLGPDTQFVRKLYTNGAGDQIFVSIVLSGPDMNTSIHRPERCLPAQGWTIADSRTTPVPIGAGLLKATRLQNLRSVPLQSGKLFNVRALNYYWFVGSSDVTPSHFARTWIDTRDRILKGRNQQWAYVMVMATITKDFKIFGRDEKQTDELIRNFIGELFPQLQKTSVSSLR
jgi:EpsI family protein